MLNPRISPYASSTGNNGDGCVKRDSEKKREEFYNIDTWLSDKYIMNLPGLWQLNFD